MIRISADEWINPEEITHIKAIDPMNCILTTEAGVFTAQMPVETLLGILRAEEPKEDAGSESAELNVLKEMSQKIGNLPVFAG